MTFAYTAIIVWHLTGPFLAMVNYKLSDGRANVTSTVLVLQYAQLHSINKNKQTRWPLVRQQTIPTDNPKMELSSNSVSQDSIISIVTGYMLWDQVVGVESWSDKEFFLPHIVQNCLRCTRLLYNEYWGLFSCQGQEYVDIYSHSPIHLCGVVLN
jgi:hypothetical protein